MAPNKTMNRAVAISAALGAALFGISACTSTVKGNATAAQDGSSTSGGSSASSGGSGSSSGSSGGSSASGPSVSSSSSGGSGGGGGSQSAEDAAQAPDQPFKYKNGVEVALGVPTPKDYDGVLSTEEGRAFPVTITNASDKIIDMSTYRDHTSIYCGADFDSSAYVFDDEPEVGTPTVGPGATSTYELSTAVRKKDLGSECVVSITFAVEGVSASSIDPAKFVITVS